MKNLLTPLSAKELLLLDKFLLDRFDDNDETI